MCVCVCSFQHCYQVACYNEKVSDQILRQKVFITKQTIKQSFNLLCKLNEAQFSELSADSKQLHKSFPKIAVTIS